MNLWDALRGSNVLLVDDDERIRDALALFFQDQGCAFSAVENSERALETLSRNTFDIVILDYKLPGMNGLDLLGKIGELHPETVRIFISAYSDEALFVQAEEAGADGFVKKPLTAEKIEACLARIDSPGGPAGPVRMTHKRETG